MEWRAVKGYEGYYEVSNTGLVRGVDRIVPDASHGVRHVTGKMLKLVRSKNKTRDADGYLVVNLHKYGVSNVIPVHRLVAESFLDNLDNMPTVNHKDGNKLNNDVSNLEWATYAENNIHALNNKLRKPRGDRIFQLSPNGRLLKEYKSACEAERITGISRATISHCLNGRAKTAGGFKWIKVEKCNDYPGYGSTTEDELPSEVQERGSPEDIVCSGENA